MSLQTKVQQIRSIDRQIVELLEERARAAKEIRDLGEEPAPNAPVEASPASFDADLICQAEAWRRGDLKAADLYAILRSIQAVYRGLLDREPVSVSGLGPVASFTHLAAASWFGPHCDYVLFDHIEDVFHSVRSRRTRYGILSLVNSISGHVQENIDLLAEHRLPICAEITIPVEYCLMGCGSLENVRRIYSHSQALAQCKKSIHRLREAFGDRENWQRLELVPTSSTTAAAAKAQGEPDAAVIATRLAGAIWQLAVLNEHLEDDPSNRTRFVIIGHERVPLTGRDRTSIWFRMPDRPGGLFSALKHLAHLNMTALVSLPIKTTPWVYAFFLEFEGHSSDPEVNQALDGLKAMCQDGDLRILGSYPQDLRP